MIVFNTRVDGDEEDILSETKKNCKHIVCYPDNWSEDERMKMEPSSEPALTYPFKLDPFQQVWFVLLFMLDFY